MMHLVVSNRKKHFKPDEQAFLIQLAALNAAIESARAGQPAMGQHAGAVGKLLERFYQSLSPSQTN